MPNQRATIAYGEREVNYCGHFIHENQGALKRILHPEGYIDRASNGTYAFYYYLKDHLGNNRVVINSSGAIVQETNYYPFGMPYSDRLVTDSKNPGLQPYKFGGKEYDTMFGLNWYDFEARQKMGILPMFTTMDPLCEKYYNINPYTYCKNNPINRIDPDGMDDYYAMDGTFLFKDDKETDNIIIRQQNRFNQSMNQLYASIGIDSNLPEFIDTPITGLTLSVESYSNIFTDILSKMDGVNIGDISNEKVSVRVVAGIKDDEYNNPDYSIGQDASIAKTKDGKISLSAIIFPKENKEMSSTVSNVQNMLGDHEYTGHGIKGWGNETRTHYKVYEYQMSTPSWNKTTPNYQRKMRERYNYYKKKNL